VLVCNRIIAYILDYYGFGLVSIGTL